MAPCKLPPPPPLASFSFSLYFFSSCSLPFPPSATPSLSFPQLSSENIQVGDILRLVENDEIPCDLVLLSCSDPLGNCFIQVCEQTILRHW
jgi:hypothetical protein